MLDLDVNISAVSLMQECICLPDKRCPWSFKPKSNSRTLGSGFGMEVVLY